MVQACVEGDDGHVLRKALEFEVRGKRKPGREEARTTKEDVEDASGEGVQERWFGGKGRHESSEMESGSWRDCCWGKSGHPRLYR